MDRFWENKTLDELSNCEWEALCDRCGKCCLIKLQDDQDNGIMYTNIICKNYNIKESKCSDYKNRRSKVIDCVSLTSQNVQDFDWLPESCAYRLRARGRSLPHWHHLVSGDKSAVHRLGHSVKGRVFLEGLVDSEELETMIVKWVQV